MFLFKDNPSQVKLCLHIAEKSIIFKARKIQVILMEITEKKIRQISDEAWQQLGSNANPIMLKKVVQEVVKRLIEESKNTPTSSG